MIRRFPGAEQYLVEGPLASMIATTGVGGLGGLALLVPMEAGIPIPVPADLVMFGVGVEVAADRLPLWSAVAGLEAVAVLGTLALFLTIRGPGRALLARLGPRVGLTPARIDRAASAVARRGQPALVIGRATPGLRSITVIAAASTGLPARRAVPALVLGSSLFLQLHLVLGILLGPLAQHAFDRAKGPTVLALVAVAAIAALFWFARKRQSGGVEGWTEAACPLCLALRTVADHHGTERVGPENAMQGAVQEG